MICLILLKQMTWNDTKYFCIANNMNVVSIESYEEDVALYSNFGGIDSKLLFSTQIRLIPFIDSSF